MYYCGFESWFGSTGKIVGFVFIGGFLMFTGMYLLSSTADVYLSPCLEFLVERFSIPESLAGVTLLAFGNGAPDVFGSIAASGDADSDSVPDANKSVSILVGGTFFICTVVIALTTFAGNQNPDPNGPPIRQIKVTPRFFTRDIGFFLITTIYLILAMLVVGGIDIYISIGFIVIYAVYVVIVVIQSKSDSDDDSDKEANQKAQLLN